MACYKVVGNKLYVQTCGIWWLLNATQVSEPGENPPAQPDFPIPPDDPINEVDPSLAVVCSKATAVADVWMSFVDSVADIADDLNLSVFSPTAWRLQYGSRFQYDKNAVDLCVSSARAINETFVPDWEENRRTIRDALLCHMTAFLSRGSVLTEADFQQAFLNYNWTPNEGMNYILNLSQACIKYSQYKEAAYDYVSAGEGDCTDCTGPGQSNSGGGQTDPLEELSSDPPSGSYKFMFWQFAEAGFGENVTIQSRIGATPRGTYSGSKFVGTSAGLSGGDETSAVGFVMKLPYVGTWAVNYTVRVNTGAGWADSQIVATLDDLLLGGVQSITAPGVTTLPLSNGNQEYVYISALAQGASPVVEVFNITATSENGHIWLPGQVESAPL